MLIKEMYDVASFDRFKASGESIGFKDSDAGIVLARNLEFINPKILEKQYPGLAFVNSGVTVDNSGGYAHKIRSLRLNTLGKFKTAGDDSANGGKISLKSEDTDILVVERTAESDWTDSEVNEAALQNTNLVDRFLAGHLKVYNREVDEAGYLGISGNKGLLNNSEFTSVNATGLASAITAAELYQDIADLITGQHNAVSNTEAYMADRVDMPVSVMNIAAVKILNSAAGPMSVLAALKLNFPGVKFNGTFRAEKVTDVLATSRTVAYSSSDEGMCFRLPLPLMIGEIIKIKSFTYHVDSKYRIGGLDILDSTAGRILAGL